VNFENHDFQAGLETVLSAAHRGAADAEEALATAARIADGDADSWVREWTATGGAAWAAADHLRAATYYAAALEQIAFGSEPERRLDLWRRQHACWRRAAERLGGERIAIPYGTTALPGTFFSAAPGERRPLVVLNNGDEPASRMWVAGGAAAAERGYHWMTFDGPGQEAARLELGLPFRSDWEAVLTPVVDAMTARPDVGPVAVIGVGVGGYLVARALTAERRFAAAVADPGVVDVAAPWTAGLSDRARDALAREDRDAFDRELRIAELFSPATAARLCSCSAAYGHVNGSRYAFFAALAAYRLGDEAAAITTPLLVTDREGERRWAGQSRRLYERLPGPKRLARDDAAVFEWLDGYLA
jgi:hypothetical protein